MPLSDREQQILSDIEARLREEDPKFAKTVSTATVSNDVRRRIKIAIAGLVVGFVLLLLVIPLGEVLVGVVGFAVMLASLVYGGNQLKRLGADQTGDLSGQLRGGFNRYLGDKRDRKDKKGQAD
jgi:hypothetical protein